ncbi:hypothetical protein FJTKL_11342 [Diaporthe vaccinii]|uniref:Uncharacterized protein n=1 Tax=Diaporthe vaccinii TaxID=105482 RepID=A0ABR4EHL2_9PEZI
MVSCSSWARLSVCHRSLVRYNVRTTRVPSHQPLEITSGLISACAQSRPVTKSYSGEEILIGSCQFGISLLVLQGEQSEHGSTQEGEVDSGLGAGAGGDDARAGAAAGRGRRAGPGPGASGGGAAGGASCRGAVVVAGLAGGQRNTLGHGGGEVRGAGDGLEGRGSALGAVGGGWLDGGALSTVGLAIALLDLDGLVGAGHVAVDVRAGALSAVHVVLDSNTLVVTVEGSLREVGVATGPLHSALGGVLAAGGPSSQLDLHRGLRVAGTSLGVGVLQRPDDGAINDPVQLLGGPVDGVGVELGLGVADSGEATTVVGGRVTLAEVVGLDLGRDEGGDDASADRGPRDDTNTAKEDVAGGGEGRRVGLLVDREDSTERWVVRHSGASGSGEEVILTLSEVNGLRRGDSRVGGAA